MYKGSDELTLYQSCVHAPVNGGPVFPGTILGYIYIYFFSKFQIRTPWCNDQNLIEPVIEGKKKAFTAAIKAQASLRLLHAPSQASALFFKFPDWFIHS